MRTRHAFDDSEKPANRRPLRVDRASAIAVERAARERRRVRCTIDLCSVSHVFDLRPFRFRKRTELNDRAAKILTFLPALDLRNARVERRHFRIQESATYRASFNFTQLLDN